MNPMCFKGFPLAVTNKDELIPCCYCDTQRNINDPDFKNLLKVSKISDYNKIDDILETKEWKEFYDLLINDIPPCKACSDTCGVRSVDGKLGEVREDTYYDTNGNMYDYKDSHYSQKKKNDDNI